MADWTHPRHQNALLAWATVLVLVVAVGVLLSGGELVAASLAAVAAALVVAPAAVRGDWRAMPPWGIAAVTTLPFLTRSVPVVANVAAYLAVAAVALLVAIYLSVYTEVEMTAQFSVALVVLTTVAVGTLWSAVRGLAEVYLGYSTLGGMAGLERDLLVTVGGGVLAGVVFEAYFRERSYGALVGTPVEEV